MTATTNVEIANGLSGYLARGGNGRRAVVVIMEAFGITGHIRNACDRLAAAGFTALAPDIFHGDIVSYGDMPRAIEKIKAQSDDMTQREIGLTIDWLTSGANGGANSVGIVGFCMGGRLAFHANCRHAGRLGAAAGFYGSGIAPEGDTDRFGRTPPIREADAMRAPMFLGFGANDSGIPPEEHARIARRLSELKKTYELKVYGGAGHAFLCDERPQMYSAEAAKVGWQDIIAFFERYLSA